MTSAARGSPPRATFFLLAPSGTLFPCPNGHSGVQDELARLLIEHADAVIDVRERHQRTREEMIGHETRINAMDGLSPALAELAARNNLAVRLRDLDNELVAELGRLQAELRRNLGRLIEDLDDNRGERQ